MDEGWHKSGGRFGFQICHLLEKNLHLAIVNSDGDGDGCKMEGCQAARYLIGTQDSRKEEGREGMSNFARCQPNAAFEGVVGFCVDDSDGLTRPGDEGGGAGWGRLVNEGLV